MIYNQRGFMMLSVVFLTLIVANCAAMLMNAIPRARSPQALLRLTAIHLANEQLAILESKAIYDEVPPASGVNFLGKPDDLMTNNFAEIKFKVKTDRKDNGNLLTYTVKVDWEFNGQDDSVVFERTVRIVPKDS